MPGPAPKPTALALYRGKKRDNPNRAKEPKTRVICPPAPSFLDATAKKEWRRIAKVLSASKVLTESDLVGLQLYCVEYSRWRDAMEQLQTSDITELTPNGHKAQSIYRTIENRAFENLIKIMREFGLTPSARTRVAAIEAEQNDTGFGKL